MNPEMIADLQAGLSQRDHLLSQLLQRIEAMEVQNRNTPDQPPQASNNTSNVPPAKKKTVKGKNPVPKASVTQPKRKKATVNPTNEHTPVRQRARSATPMSAKKSPLQMVKQDHPQGFEHTKEAFYVHIKVLWGLVPKNSVPVAPSEEQLRSFYQRFRCTDEIDSAISGGPSLLALDTIQTLKKAREQRQKVGKHMIHLSEFNIRYIHSSLSQLGITTWLPNLDEQPDSLYNVAHRMAAIKTFRECVAGNAYSFMNINHAFIEDFELLKQAYDHYVHYVWLNVYSKEKKEKGKHRKDEERKALQTARERLRDRRYKFAVNQNFPKRYLKIIKPVQAHSDDEYFPKKEVYLIKKLPFRSEAANEFFRRLDDVMKNSGQEDGKRSLARRRIRIKNAPMTIFPKAPKNMPLDFYDVNWFNSKLPAQRQNLADLDSVAFIKNPMQSLMFTDPTEKLGNTRFVESRWDEATKDYNLDFLEQQDSDSPSESDEASDYGASIDLSQTDGEEDEEDDSEEDQEEDDGDEDMGVGGSGTREEDENYEEFDDNVEMSIEHFGKGTYTGGLHDNEWNAWQ